mmetsp:Transcript_45205/g.51305  ORF Transcript_45205/g.51305 Transcript_45205/m.51305 type:complete len:89 (+) Transcript_45205:72-338(+)
MNHGVVAYVLNESFVASSPVPGERKFGGESPKRDDEQESFAQNSSSSMTLPGTVRQLPVDNNSITNDTSKRESVVTPPDRSVTSTLKK